MNFLEFLQSEDGIRIPMIQREYVQGRKSLQRETFLKDIFTTLKENKEVRQLDLVYGNTVSELFQPIDGQQRLTTLFLLYYYISLREGQFPNIRKELAKFQYDIRPSSKNFCEKLIEYGERLELQREDLTISAQIQEAGWYYIEYQFDFTVQSMMEMLDCIHDRYCMEYCTEKKKQEDAGKPVPLHLNYYGGLSRLVFQLVELKDYPLGEELYVIMNDRGKPLSAFENLRSTILGWMQNGSGKDYFNQEDKWLDFSTKLDTVWSEKLWNIMDGLVKNGKIENMTSDEATDRGLYRLFCRYLRNLLPYEESSKKEDAERQYLEKADETAYDAEVFLKVLKKVVTDAVTAENFYKDFCLFMNYVLGQHHDDYEKMLKNCWEDEYDPVYALNFNLESQVIHYGISLYLKKNQTLTGAQQWMRFVNNLAEVQFVANAREDAVRVIHILDAWADHTKDIYGQLAIVPVTQEDLASLRQEKIKAQYQQRDQGQNNNDWEKMILTMEKHSWLRGDIDILLESVEEKQPDGSIQRKADPKDTYTKMQDRWTKAKKLFGEEGLNPGQLVSDPVTGKQEYPNLLLRAILSQMDFQFTGGKRGNTQELHLDYRDTDRRQLKTLLRGEWKGYIQKYLNALDPEKAMEAAGKAPVVWGKGQEMHELLCRQDFLSWIQENSNAAKNRPRLVVRNGDLRIVYGSNASGPRLSFDKNTHKIVELIQNIMKKAGWSYDNGSQGQYALWKDTAADIYVCYAANSEPQMIFKKNKKKNKHQGGYGHKSGEVEF